MNTPTIIGRQTFDGLGRQLTVEAAGYLTHHHYTDGQLSPTANTLADGKRIAFTYEKALNNKLLSVTPEGETAQSITYHPLGMPASASGALGTEAFNFTGSGQPKQDRWTVDKAQYDTHWRYSMNGLLLGFTDPQGTPHQRTLDVHGRVKKTRVGNVTTRYRYDALSRPVAITVSESDSGRTLTTSLTYDSCGREHTRTLQVATADDNATRTFTQTLAYSALDQVTSRLWAEGDVQGKETFEYDIRGRLTRYTANENASAQDPFGNRIVSQVFTFNALNGHEQVVTTFDDGSEDDAHFTYAEHNPVQVVKVSHTHESWPQELTLSYDACGRVVGDSLGRELVWNAQDRLIEVRHNERTCQYGYTAHGRLADRNVDGSLTRSFFSGDELTHDQIGENSVQYCSGEQGLFAVNKLTDGIRQTTLLGSDAQGSVRLEADSSVRTRHYSAYGVERQNEEHVAFGYAGQRHEPLTNWQILGDYRPYDPVLMCFLSPDSESPFGNGGINPYAYCAGDPVNRIDPDGHSWVSYTLAGVGLAIGVAAAVASVGAAAPVFGSLLFGGLGSLTPGAMMIICAAVLDVVSLGTGVGAFAIELAGGDENIACILGSVSLATGLAAGALSGMGQKVAKAAGRKAAPPSPATRRQMDAHVLWEKKPDKHDVTFYEQFWGDSNLKAFETHGDPLGNLLNARGAFEPAENVARREIAPRLANYDQSRPMVLIACEGGSSGAAQRVANVLRRPVIGYDEVIYVGETSKMQYYFHNVGRKGLETSLPLKKIPFYKCLTGTKGPGYAIGKEFDLATSRTYWPQ